jgi:tetratricopeptide (TPR) repeat protein
MGIMPAAGHIVHMPGHIWLLLGEWQTAVDVNERAVEVDREYFVRTNVTGGTYEPYYFHNLDFILYARSMQGRRVDALHAIDELDKAVAPMAASMPEMADMFSAIPMLSLARYHEWDRILKLPEPGATLKSSRLLRHYVRCLAFAARRDRRAAETELAAFEKSREEIAENASWGQNKARDVHACASEVLVARLASSSSEAVSHWQQAVELQDRLTYDEPPAWYYPVRESLGAALLRAGEAAKAEGVFREGVRRTPHDGWMLFGLLESLKAQNKQPDANWVKRELDAVWAKSDVVLRLEDF